MWKISEANSKRKLKDGVKREAFRLTERTLMLVILEIGSL